MDDIQFSNYDACTKQALRITNDLTGKKAEWMRRILFLGATLFGILISLYGETQASLYTRLCFASACISLALGLITLSVASYHHIAIASLTHKKYLVEIQNAIQEGRPVSFVSSSNIKIFVICEICSYILLLLSVLLLAIYTFLLVIFGS